jgi:hypothetical protein
MIVVYKDGESKIVKSRYLLRFLDAGWSQEPPKSKTPKFQKAKVVAEAEVIPVEPQVEEQPMPILEETNDGNL